MKTTSIKAESFSSQLSAQLDDYLERDSEGGVSFENQPGQTLAQNSLTSMLMCMMQRVNYWQQVSLRFLKTICCQVISTLTHCEKLKRGENVAIETERVGYARILCFLCSLKGSADRKANRDFGNSILSVSLFHRKGSDYHPCHILNIFVLIFIVLVILSYFVPNGLLSL